MTVRRLIALILLPCYLVACTSWKTQEASPEQVLADEQSNKVQVTLADGSQVVLEQPVVAGDTLTGSVDGEQRSIPLADVSSIAVQGTDGVKTGLLVFGVVVVAVGVILVAGFSGACNSC